MNTISPEWVIGGVLGVLCLIFIYYLFGKEHYPYTARKTLLTYTEQKFYKQLMFIIMKEFPYLSIAPQVRLADIITCTDDDWHKGYGPKISAKHIDFVLFDEETTEIILCIELDDPSHDQKDRKRRDVFINNALQSADVELCRITTKDASNQEFITSQIKKHIL
jgi:hypothetical protein